MPPKLRDGNGRTLKLTDPTDSCTIMEFGGPNASSTLQTTMPRRNNGTKQVKKNRNETNITQQVADGAQDQENQHVDNSAQTVDNSAQMVAKQLMQAMMQEFKTAVPAVIATVLNPSAVPLPVTSTSNSNKNKDTNNHNQSALPSNGNNSNGNNGNNCNGKTNGNTNWNNYVQPNVNKYLKEQLKAIKEELDHNKKLLRASQESNRNLQLQLSQKDCCIQKLELKIKTLEFEEHCFQLKCDSESRSRSRDRHRYTLQNRDRSSSRSHKPYTRRY